MTATNPNPAGIAGPEAPRRFAPSGQPPGPGVVDPARQLMDAYAMVRTLTVRGPAWVTGRRRRPVPRRLVLLHLDQHTTTRLNALRRGLHASAAARDEADAEEATLGRVDHALAALPVIRTRWWILASVVSVAIVAHAGIAALRAVTDPGTTRLGEVMEKANLLVESLTGSLLSLNFKQFSDAATAASREPASVLVFVVIVLLLSAWLVLRPYVWAFHAKRRVLAENGVRECEREALGDAVREQPIDILMGAIPVLPFAYLGLFMAGALITGSLELPPDQSPAGAAVIAALLLTGVAARAAVLARRWVARTRSG